MQAIRNLAAGSMLRLSDLTPIDIIRKGDNVQLSVRAGALEITVTMLALENARRDQRVLLLNPESGEESSRQSPRRPGRPADLEDCRAIALVLSGNL